MSYKSTRALTVQEKKERLQVIQNNINNEPLLAPHIKPYESMGYNWVVNKKTIQIVGRDSAGDLLAYCADCGMYHPFDEMSKDALRGPYGIKQKC